MDQPHCECNHEVVAMNCTLARENCKNSQCSDCNAYSSCCQMDCVKKGYNNGTYDCPTDNNNHCKCQNNYQIGGFENVTMNSHQTILVEQVAQTTASSTSSSGLAEISVLLMLFTVMIQKNFRCY